jgi:hypothetical protein
MFLPAEDPVAPDRSIEAETPARVVCSGPQALTAGLSTPYTGEREDFGTSDIAASCRP